MSSAAVAGKGQAASSPSSAWTGISLAGALGLLLHHMALALQVRLLELVPAYFNARTERDTRALLLLDGQGAKLQQVELLALSNSQARSWAEQGELNKVNDTLLGMRSQVGCGIQRRQRARNSVGSTACCPARPELLSGARGGGGVQMVTDLDQLYNAVNRLEAALAETKAFQVSRHHLLHGG